VGITKPVGWHTFRHTFSTLLRANGEDVKVVQELLRHASIRTTLDVYTQAVSSAKREAQNRLVGMIVPESQVAQNTGETIVVPLSCPNEVSHEVPYIQ
jgi:site-specific recombinase XerD